jgi:hypothetical protein
VAALLRRLPLVGLWRFWAAALCRSRKGEQWPEF